MHIEKVYCVELDRVIDIYEAKDEYFKQLEPRRKFTFLCSDKNCREQNKTEVIGVVYTKHPDEDDIKVAPHFREKDEHIDTCEWVEMTKALDQLDEKKQRGEISESATEIKLRENGLKRSDIVQIFKLKKTNSKASNNNNTQDDDEELSAIRKINSPSERQKAYEKFFSDRKISTNKLHNVVSSYHVLYDRKLLEEVDLTINNKIMKYREWFKHIEYYNLNYMDRILYGGATVSKFDQGYIILFFNKNRTTSVDLQGKEMFIYISNETIKKYKHCPHLIDIFDMSIKEKIYIKVFFFNAEIQNSTDSKKLKVVLDELDYLHVMLSSPLGA